MCRFLTARRRLLFVLAPHVAVLGGMAGPAPARCTPEEWCEYLEYAYLAHDAYLDHSEFIGLPDHEPFRRVAGGEPASGLNWALYQRLDLAGRIETVLAFAGTEFRSRDTDAFDLRDIATDFDQALRHYGPLSPQYADALQIVTEVAHVLDHVPSRPLTVVGHSLGGGIAQFTAAKLGIRAVGFSSAAIGPTTIAAIDKSLRDNVGRNLAHVYAAGDIVFEGSPLLPGSDHLGVIHRLPGSSGDGFLAPHELETVIMALREMQAHQYTRFPAMAATEVNATDLRGDLVSMNVDLTVSASDLWLDGFGAAALATYDAYQLSADRDEWRRHNDDALTRSAALGLDVMSLALRGNPAGALSGGLSNYVKLADALHKATRARRLQNEAMGLLSSRPGRDAPMTVRESFGSRGGRFEVRSPRLSANGVWTFRKHRGSSFYHAAVEFALDDRYAGSGRAGTGSVERIRETSGAPFWNPFDLFEPSRMVTTTRRTSRTNERFDGRAVQREIERRRSIGEPGSDESVGGVDMKMEVDESSFVNVEEPKRDD